MTPDSFAWSKSSYSVSSNGQCVEVADLPALHGVRDSQHRDLGALFFDCGEWRAFLSGVKHGEL